MSGLLLLRGAGAAVMKSAALLFVSVQPPLTRQAARVVLSAVPVGEPSVALLVLP